MNMNKKIEDDFIRIIQSHQRIGVFVSGGMDSSLMAYLLYYTRAVLESDNEFRFFTVPRHDDSVVHARRILNYLSREFKTVYPEHHIVGNPNLHHTQQVGSGLAHALNMPDLTLILNGTNSTPDEVPGGPERRNARANSRVYLPFFNYTKEKLVEVYIDMVLIDLMEITHTCTESKLIRCRTCWQCKERAWAFETCGYTDPGRM